MTDFLFKPAKREGVGLFIGVAGASGSGKTMSALRIARGIAGPDGRVAAIDTEARRMSHYAGQFKFDVSDMLPPFRPERFAAAAEDAERSGYSVLVVDSFSLEWAGEGGVLDWHDELKGDDEKMNMRAWVKPKQAHKMMISSFLQRRIPLVFCFRAEEKVKVGAGGRPEPQGWMPIGDPRFMFELTTMLTLSNEMPGIVSYRLPRKIQEQHLVIFPDGKPITEDAGARLAAWARGEDIAGTPLGSSTANHGTDKTKVVVDELAKKLEAATTDEAVTAVLTDPTAVKQIDWMSDRRPDQHTRLYEHVAAARKRVKDTKAATA